MIDKFFSILGTILVIAVAVVIGVSLVTVAIAAWKFILIIGILIAVVVYTYETQYGTATTWDALKHVLIVVAVPFIIIAIACI